jgi:hypothetical protein
MVTPVVAKRHQAAEAKQKNPPWRLRRATARNIQLRGQILRRTNETTRVTARFVEHKVDELAGIIAAAVRATKGKTVGVKHVRYALSQSGYRRFIPTSIASTKLRIKKAKRAKKAAAADGAPKPKQSVSKKVAAAKTKPSAKAAETAEAAAEPVAAPAAAADAMADEDLVPDT